MSTRTIIRRLSPPLALSLLCALAIPQSVPHSIFGLRAQDRSRRPRLTQPPQQPARPNDPQGKNGSPRPDNAPGETDADKAGTMNIDTDMVLLDVKVVDQRNNPVPNLRKEDFSVFEDKVKQSIDHVSSEEAPISFGILIDTSGSMRSKLMTVANASRTLIHQMRHDDEAFLGSFKTDTELLRGFTADQRDLDAAIGELYTSGGTALLDAIIAGSDYAQEQGHRRRKALIVITDGLEKNSSSKEKAVLEAIKEDEVQVYLVGVFDDDMKEGGFLGRSPEKRAKDLLTRIAEDSGGRAFFPKDIGEVPAIAAQISKDLRTQYIVSYYPTNEKRDGTFRTVQIGVTQSGHKLIAHARNGYYARTEQGQLPSPAAAPKKTRGH
jgi:Ca-activated chloride channel family protein